MKKLLAILLAMVLVLGMAACGAKTEEAPAPEVPVEEPAEVVETPAEEPEAPAEEPTEDGAKFDGDVSKLGPIMKKIYETGVFEAGYTAQKPPQQFHLTVDGQDTVVGFEVWISDLIAERLSEYFGREVKQNINIFTVAGGLAALQAEQLDCMPTLSATPERKENYDFSQAYHRSLQTVMYLDEREGEACFELANGLEGVTVAVQKGSTNESGLILQYPKCTVLSLEKQSDVLISVLTGKADACLMNEKTAILYCAANPELMYDLELSYNVDKEKDPGASYCVPKGNEDFVAVIDEVLTEIIADGRFTQLEKDAIALCDNSEVLAAYMAENLE